MMNELKQSNAFLKKTYNKYLFPTVLSVLGGTVNVFVDGLLVGQRLGTSELVAVNLCMPIYLLICTFGSLIASGAAIKSSHKIGNEKLSRSDDIYSLSIVMITALSLLLTVFGVLLVSPIARLLTGREAQLFEAVRAYSFVTVLGTLPKMLLYVPFYYLRLDGKNRYLSFVMGAMAVMNIFLDWLMLFVLDYGIMGAATASVLATLIACILAFIPFITKKCGFSFVLPHFKIADIFSIIKTGSPAAMNNLMSALRVFSVNSLLLIFGGRSFVSIFAVVNNMSEFFICIINGVPQTAVPIIGIYEGESNDTGIKIIMRHQFLSGVPMIALCSTAAVLASDYIALAFGVKENITFAMLCFAIGLVFAMINNIMCNYYSCTYKTMLANMITVARLLVFSVIPIIYLGYLSEKSNIIWLFLPISEVLTLLLWLGTVGIISRKNPSLSKILLMDRGVFNNQSVLDFSVESTPEAICESSERISDFCSENKLTHKESYGVSLAIEECLTLMCEKCFPDGKLSSFDLRAFASPKRTGVRIRCGGESFNPIEFAKESDEFSEYMGIVMISKFASNITYQRTFGTNCLIIIINRKEEIET